MAERAPTRLSAAEGRRFGVTTGVAFLVFGALFLWRGHELRAVVASVAGGALVGAGLLVPTTLGPVERAWMGLAHALSKVTTPILMGIIYFLVITPMGVIRRRFGTSPVLRAGPADSRWVRHGDDAEPRARMERQF